MNHTFQIKLRISPKTSPNVLLFEDGPVKIHYYNNILNIIKVVK